MWNKIIILWAVIATITSVLFFVKYKDATRFDGFFHPLTTATEAIDIITDVEHFNSDAVREALIDLHEIYNFQLTGIYSLFCADCFNIGNYAFYLGLESLYKKTGMKMSEETIAFAVYLLKKGVDSDDLDTQMNSSEALYGIYDNGLFLPRDTTQAKYYYSISEEAAKRAFVDEYYPASYY